MRTRVAASMTRAATLIRRSRRVAKVALASGGRQLVRSMARQLGWPVSVSRDVRSLLARLILEESPGALGGRPAPAGRQVPHQG